MPTRPRLSLALLVVLAGAAHADGGGRPAPLYALPPDGIWVEYAWTAVGPDGDTQTGVLRLSSVGRTKAAGKPRRWVEVKKVYRREGRDHTHLRKFLLDETALGAGKSFHESVLEVFDRQESGGRVTRLSPARAGDFLTLGFTGPRAALKEVRAREDIQTPLGTFSARHVSAQAKRGRRTLDYHAWLTGEVPFSWARMEVREALDKAPQRTVFTATAARSGRQARSELDEMKESR